MSMASHPIIRDDVTQIFLGLVSAKEAKDIEVGIYNASIDLANANKIPLTWQSDVFREIYLAKARSVFANLNDESYIGNTNLIERLKDGEFQPHDIANMERENIFPEKWRAILEAEDRKLKSAYENTQTAMSDQITCGKCKKKKVSYYELQTRGGDEATSIFYTCLVCGHKWKRA
jgi:DNA-directed RNA polymerase subunit M/transcription elongation factor TFIIS